MGFEGDASGPGDVTIRFECFSIGCFLAILDSGYVRFVPGNENKRFVYRVCF